MGDLDGVALGTPVILLHISLSQAPPTREWQKDIEGEEESEEEMDKKKRVNRVTRGRLVGPQSLPPRLDRPSK